MLMPRRVTSTPKSRSSGWVSCTPMLDCRSSELVCLRVLGASRIVELHANRGARREQVVRADVGDAQFGVGRLGHVRRRLLRFEVLSVANEFQSRRPYDPTAVSRGSGSRTTGSARRGCSRAPFLQPGRAKAAAPPARSTRGRRRSQGPARQKVRSLMNSLLLVTLLYEDAARGFPPTSRTVGAPERLARFYPIRRATASGVGVFAETCGKAGGRRQPKAQRSKVKAGSRSVAQALLPARGATRRH